MAQQKKIGCPYAHGRKGNSTIREATMKLNFKTYQDKVYACWQGKSIGGTLGAPYEMTREKLHITGFAPGTRGALPNDDLDLQLVWLQALEYEGVNLTSEILGEYWLSFITPHWAEYGIAKQHMKAGLPAQVSGDYANVWKHSNGAWIRTEIWATLAPACPELAVRYASEDAKVDHGLGEGTYAAAFVAAMEAAAFVISDVRQLIQIGLAHIPETSRMAKTVQLVLSCFDGGKTAEETRDIIVAENADIGDGWFQAPSNVGFVILGLLYGEGDFKKSMLYAINCGDDTDCTGATIGSIMGIMKGTKGIPKDWMLHVGEKIVTCSLNEGVSFLYPKTLKELTARVVDYAPVMLIQNRAPVRFTFGHDELGDDLFEKLTKKTDTFLHKYDAPIRSDFVSRKENSFLVNFGYASAVVTYGDGPTVCAGQTKKIRIRFINNVKAHGNQPHTLRVKCISAPEGFTVDKSDTLVYLPHWSLLTEEWVSEPIEITITAGERVEAVSRLVFEVTEAGRYTAGYISVTFLNM